MNPPKHIVDKMLADGPKGVLQSILCLGAAMAVKRGVPIEEVKLEDVGFNEVPGIPKERMVRAMRLVYEDFKRGTPAQIDHAIALYRAHLKAAGYEVEEGLLS